MWHFLFAAAKRKARLYDRASRLLRVSRLARAASALPFPCRLAFAAAPRIVTGRFAVVATTRRFARCLRRATFSTARLLAATTAALTATALTTVLNRLGFDRRIRLVTRNGDARDLFLQQAFDIMQQLMFIYADQRQRFARCRSAPGTTNTVHVIFRHVWQLVVHHVRQLFNIQTARGDIGCDQHADAAGFKISQRSGTRALALVAVNSGAADAVFIELFRQVVCAVFGAGKDQNLLPVTFADHLRQQLALALFIDKMHQLAHLLRSGVTAGDFDFQRVMQQLFRQ